MHSVTGGHGLPSATTGPAGHTHVALRVPMTERFGSGRLKNPRKINDRQTAQIQANFVLSHIANCAVIPQYDWGIENLNQWC